MKYDNMKYDIMKKFMKRFFKRFALGVADKGIEEVKLQYNWHSKLLKFLIVSLAVLMIILMISIIAGIVIASFSVL